MGAGRGYGKYLSMGLASESADVVAASRSLAELKALKDSRAHYRGVG
jgi:NAD(P)-dependent dehydrogenase (short-subunit alcohol dehydrogenase family)